MLDQAAFETMSFYEGAAVAVICSARKVSQDELTELMDGIIFSKGDKDYDEAVKMMKMFQAMLEMKFLQNKFKPGYLANKQLDLEKAALWCDGFMQMFFKVNGVDTIRNDENLSKTIIPFLLVSGRSDDEMREQLKEKYTTKEEYNHYKITVAEKIDQLVNSLYSKNHQNFPTADTAKIGRNDDCPCGSGKKFKKCCALKTAKH